MVAQQVVLSFGALDHDQDNPMTKIYFGLDKDNLVAKITPSHLSLSSTSPFLGIAMYHDLGISA